MIVPRPLVRAVGGALAAGFCVLSPSLPRPAPALAAPPRLTESQRLVAETWKTVDRLFVDRTFNHHGDWFSLRQEYVRRPYGSTEEAYAAATELVSVLDDQYTRFLPPSRYQSLVGSATGEVAGVGVELLEDSSGRVIVGDVQPESPAAQLGLKPGDKLVSVDAEALDGLTVDDAAVLLRGPPGTRVGLVVERGGEKIDYIAQRALFRIVGVTSKLTSVGNTRLGVVRIKSFSSSTAEDTKRAVGDLERQGIDVLALDLRNNAGGLLPGGIDTARLFLPQGKVVVTVVNYKGTTETSMADEAGPETKQPIVILTNRKTASAAEVLTGALVDNGRAVSVGETSFGKGIIQTIQPLPGGAGVAVTQAKYRTPTGTDINRQGIQPARTLTCDLVEDAAACLAKDPQVLQLKPVDSAAAAAASGL